MEKSNIWFCSYLYYNMYFDNLKQYNVNIYKYDEDLKETFKEISYDQLWVEFWKIEKEFDIFQNFNYEKPISHLNYYDGELIELIRYKDLKIIDKYNYNYQS